MLLLSETVLDGEGIGAKRDTSSRMPRRARDFDNSATYKKSIVIRLVNRLQRCSVVSTAVAQHPSLSSSADESLSAYLLIVSLSFSLCSPSSVCSYFLAPRRSNDCAKCEPIDPALLLARKNCARPLPTPVTRQEVAPDGEFLELDPASGQPGPVGPNPKLEGGERATVAEGTAVSTSRVPVAPEWRVLQAAHGAKQRSGEEAAKLMRTFRKFFKDVDACAGKRLWVGKSAVQVGLTAWHQGA